MATDIDDNTGFRPYTFSTGTAGGMTVNPGSLPSGFINTAYNQTISGSSGTGPYTFTVTSGTLPTGLTLTSGGVLSGTATAGGSFTFTVKGNDSAGNTDTNTYTYTVHIGTNSLTLAPSTLPNGSLTVPYNQTVTASGGSGSGYVYSISSGSLPTGLSLGAGGAITGTPTVAGPYSFTVRAVDSFNNAGTQAYNVTIGSNILTVTPSSQPNGTVGVGYSQNFSATAAPGPIRLRARLVHCRRASRHPAAAP